MTRPFADELRSDTSSLIIPLLTGFTILVAIFAAIFSSGQESAWHFWLIILLAPLNAIVSWRLIKRGHQPIAIALFTSFYLFSLSLLMARHWQPGSVLPYTYIILVVIGSMMYHPNAGLAIWLASVLSMLIGLAVQDSVTFSNVASLLPPIIIGLILAVVAFLSAVEWQSAVESISLLHVRAQERRDELFAAKEEITAFNNHLHYLNHELEEARQQALLERDLRTRFMNNVSHELRTPLNAIVNFAHILKLGGQGPINEGQVEYLERMEQSGWHLLAVLNDLLDMAQIQSGEFKLYLEETPLQLICEEAMKNLRGLLMDKEGVEIIRDYPDRWPVVMVDQTRLKQALLNLLGNAAKYTEEGHVALRVYPQEETVQLIVEDTGIGIASEHHTAVFQEFRQVDESAARKRIGTGLGLPITRHLIERHNGTISVKSQPGEGSQFIITLPIHTP